MAAKKGKLHSAAVRAREWLMDYAYVAVLAAVITVVLATYGYTRQLHARYEGDVAAAAGALEISPCAESTPAAAPQATIPPRTAAPSGIYAAAAAPVTGGVLRGYSDAPVYWAALSCLQAHRAVDIAGDAGGSVLCAVDGVVESAAMDALWGWRVAVRHTDGSVCEYAGLQLSCVEKGQRVTRGSEIGILMERIPCEAELGAHLHIEWTKDGKKCDPAPWLAVDK